MTSTSPSALFANTTKTPGPLIQEPMAILAVLLAVLAVLFWIAHHPRLKVIFKFVPLLIFAYFIPTLLANTNVIPLESDLYKFVRDWFLPASLFLLTMSVDIPGIIRLGPKMLILFLGATASIVIGGPLAYLCLGWLVPESLGDQAWKGLAALSGSWIGGTANMVAIKNSVGAGENIFSLMIVIDVAVANLWMFCLLYFAGNSERTDRFIGANRQALDELQQRVEKHQKEAARPTSLPDLMIITALAIGATVAATLASYYLPQIGDIIKGFTWVVIIVTALGVSLSFTPVRKLEGAGSTAVGSLFLYILVATIGARGKFSAILEAPGLFFVGLAWMTFHALFVLLLCFLLRAPIFFAAVGSKANVGGAASAPIVASAFHPALAPVGVLLAVAGYVLGTYAGLVCAFLLERVHFLFYSS